MANGLQVCPGFGNDEFEVFGRNLVGQVDSYGQIFDDHDGTKTDKGILYGVAVR